LQRKIQGQKQKLITSLGEKQQLTASGR